MDDSFLYQRNIPIQSKSLQYIFTEPTQFTAPQVGAENIADRDFIVEDKPKEIKYYFVKLEDDSLKTVLDISLLQDNKPKIIYNDDVIIDFD